MHFPLPTLLLLLPTLALTSPTRRAPANAIIANHCPFPVTVYPVGSSVGPATTLPANTGLYSEPLQRDAATGGRALKIVSAPADLYTAGKAQTVFEYNLAGDGNVWYDLSDVFGDLFAGYKLVEGSRDASCGSVVWPQGVNPGGSQVRECGEGSDVVLDLCA
ncbi:Bys1 family protein [Trichodelitschia bisporula]|uniref:Bys1 family protein n=1 Tax=Trichodelitschia bisporula TaxID=703511 RepID=A0A6G1HKL9_9PEZI|nr:Bys1 family protein [Trichodelitschia bisporula]